MNHKKGLAIFLSIACAAILGSVFLLGKALNIPLLLK